MAKSFDDWSRKTISEGSRFNRWLVDKGLTWKDADEWLEENKRPSNMEESFVRKPIRKCPNCGGIMKLFSIDDTHSKWECCKTCSQDPCGYIELIDEPIEAIIEENKNGIEK